MKYVKLTAKKNSWFDTGTEVWNRRKGGSRMTEDEWATESVIIFARGIRTCSTASEIETFGGEVKRIDEEACPIEEFDVELTYSDGVKEIEKIEDVFINP